MKLALSHLFCRHTRALVGLTFALTLVLPVAAGAHPLGNFTINRYSRVEISAAQVRVRYVVDMAEIPTYQERARLGLDRDAVLSTTEQDRYLAETVAVLQRNLHLTINGEPLALYPDAQRLEFLPGQGGLPTLRLSGWFAANLPPYTVWQADYRDDNFASRLGWQELIVQAMPGASLIESSVPAQDLSDELRNYPQDPLQSMPVVSRATFRFAPAGTSGQAGIAKLQGGMAAAGSLSIQNRNSDRFTALIAMPELGPGSLALALLIAFVWGAAHALSPGHGKTIVAAYLVGSRATARHALFLGATTTITHTAGVFLLGLITLFASRYIVPEQLYPWLEAISGLLVITIGASLLAGRLRRLLHPHSHDHEHTYYHRHEADHVHLRQQNHDHDHSHLHVHDHDHPHHQAGASHSHLPPGANGTPITRRSLLAIGISGGLLPCPAALVVMLGAIALNRLGLGLLLIVAFSLGLASTLTAIGLVMVHAETLLLRPNLEASAVGRLLISSRAVQALPVVSALIIVLAGIGITLTALAQAGMLRV